MIPLWDYQRSGQQTIVIPTPRPEPQKPRADHRSPAKIKRDAERAEQRRLNDQIDQCDRLRNAETIADQERLEEYQSDERKIVDAKAWTDEGHPLDPDSRGVVPWPGERVSTIASKLLGIEVGEVLQRKRGRRIIYVHASMIPR